MFGFDKAGTGIVIMANSSHGESNFREPLDALIGDTFTAWEWENYIPWDAAVKP